MTVTLELPDRLLEILQKKAEEGRESVDAVVLRTLETAFETGRLKEPPVRGTGKLGPLFPVDENPHDFMFS